MIAAGFAGGGGVVTGGVADGGEGFTPGALGFAFRVEAALAVVKIETVDRGEDVDERGGGVEGGDDEGEVALEEGLDAVGTELVALGFATLVEPSAARLAVGRERDGVVGEVVGVGVDVDVVVVQSPEGAARGAEAAEGAEIVERAEGREGRENVGEAVVIAPALPRVDDREGIGEAVVEGAGEAGGVVGVAAAPEIEDEASGFLGDAGRGGFVVERAVADGAVEGAGETGQEGEGGVGVRAELVEAARGIDVAIVDGRVAGREQREAAGEIETDVARREVVAAGAGAEGLRIDDAVAVAVVDARGGLIGGVEREGGEGIGALDFEAEGGAVGPGGDGERERIVVDAHGVDDAVAAGGVAF